MSVATPIPLLQHLPDVNVTPAVGVDEYALVYDHDTARFVLRAPFSGTPYALLAGRAGGQVLYGGTGANDDITIHGTSDATRTTSYVILQPTAGNVGVGVATPTDAKFQVNQSVDSLSGGIAVLNVSTNRSLRMWVDVNNVARLSSGGSESGNLSINGAGTGNVGIADIAPAEKLDVTGNINATGVYKVDDVQVLSNRVIDARCADVANSGDATTDGLIDALRDALIAHGLIAAA